MWSGGRGDRCQPEKEGRKGIAVECRKYGGWLAVWLDAVNIGSTNIALFMFVDVASTNDAKQKARLIIAVGL